MTKRSSNKTKPAGELTLLLPCRFSDSGEHRVLLHLGQNILTKKFYVYSVHTECFNQQGIASNAFLNVKDTCAHSKAAILGFIRGDTLSTKLSIPRLLLQPMRTRSRDKIEEPQVIASQLKSRYRHSDLLDSIAYLRTEYLQANYTAWHNYYIHLKPIYTTNQHRPNLLETEVVCKANNRIVFRFHKSKGPDNPEYAHLAEALWTIPTYKELLSRKPHIKDKAK